MYLFMRLGLYKKFSLIYLLKHEICHNLLIIAIALNGNDILILTKIYMIFIEHVVSYTFRLCTKLDKCYIFLLHMLCYY